MFYADRLVIAKSYILNHIEKLFDSFAETFVILRVLNISCRYDW